MKHFNNILKAVISLGLLGYLIYKAEPARIFGVMEHIGASGGVLYLAAAIVFALLSLYVMAFRWQILLNGYQVGVALKKLSGYYFIGLFFNNFLPTSIGGDVIRIYKVVSHTGSRTTGFATVVIERMMGIASTLSMAIIALFFISQYFHSARLLYIALGLLVFISAFFLIMVRNRPFKLLLQLVEKVSFFKIGEKLNKLFEAIHHFRERRRILVYVFILSFISQFAIVMMNYMIARAFEIEVGLNYLIMVVPVTFLLTMLPSINGLGIRDLGYINLLGQVGISDAAAISMSFMNLLIPMFISIYGAFLFVIQKRKEKEEGLDVVKKYF